MESISLNSTVPYLQFETLPGINGATHAIFTRRGGISPAPFASLNMSVSVKDHANNVAANQARAYGVMGRSTKTLVHAHLEHGAKVMQVGQEHHGTIPGRFDGMITDEPGCGLTMNFADCAPIVLVDPVRHAIGLGHAGWKGAIVDLPGAMVRAMQEAFGSKPEQLWAGIGPSIGPCCYEVGEPVISEVEKAFSRPDDLLIPQENGTRPHFHLPEANRVNLQRAGVTHIEMSPYCTACRTDLFFSHRAEKGRTGRFGLLLIL